MCELSPIPFHGDTIFCVEHEGQPFAPMKPIVENMGLAWQTQARKLTDNKERWGITIMMIPSEKGEQQTLCMPVRKLPAFRSSINPKKVRPELREKIELYQAECDDALWAYWTEGKAERSAQPSLADAPLTPDQQCTLRAIVKAKVESIPEAKGLYPQIWSRFNNHFRLGSYKQLPQCRLSEAIEYLTTLEVEQKALPAAAAPAIPATHVTNGILHLPGVNKDHVAGPCEAGLVALWNDWGKRAGEIEIAFESLLREIDSHRGPDFNGHVLAALGRNADTMFSTDCLCEGLSFSRTEARQGFERAINAARLYLRMSTSMAVALGR